METEVWKDISGYEGVYQASSLGRIRSLDQSTRPAFRPAVLPGRIMKTWSCRGYLNVKLVKNGSRRSFLVHRLIAQEFLQEDPSRQFVNHKNFIRNDNRVENLEWCTASENAFHKIAGNTQVVSTLQVTPKDVPFIKSILERGIPINRLERIFRKNDLVELLSSWLHAKSQ